MIRAELTRCFVLVLFLLVSGQILFCPAPRCLSGHINRNSTIIKHRASSALVSPTLLLFLLTWPNPQERIRRCTSKSLCSAAPKIQLTLFIIIYCNVFHLYFTCASGLYFYLSSETTSCGAYTFLPSLSLDKNIE